MANPMSLITTPIELLNNGKLNSRGTGFYYFSKWDNIDVIFLVTNYHVMTGNAPKDKNKGFQGDSIIFYYHIDEDKPGPVVGVKIPLFHQKDKRLWLEHTNPSVDIVLLPVLFSLPFEPKWKVIDKSYMNTDIKVSPADLITLIGYPRMYFDKKNALPIYKTGHVASEIEYDFDGESCFLIDISAFEGNSGSPVLALQKNAQIITEQIFLKAPGTTVRFLGVYSAGITDKGHYVPIHEIRNDLGIIVTDLDMQLGVVWKEFLIEEIINQHSYKQYLEILNEVMEKREFQYKISDGLNLF